MITRLHQRKQMPAALSRPAYTYLHCQILLTESEPDIYAGYAADNRKNNV